MNHRLYKYLFSGLCLAGLLAACRGGGKQKKRPYSPIDGDTVSVIIDGCQRQTVAEAMEEAFGKGTPQDNEHRALRRQMERKYKLLGDSLRRKLLRGEPIH